MSQEQFFVTLGVMTDGSIPPGHGFLAISKLKNQRNRNEKVELVTGFSFYSEDFMGVLKPFGPGHVICEKYKWMVNMPGLRQVTLPVTECQLAKILHKVNTDRRDFTHSKPVKDNKFKPGGPFFNLFAKRNCKTYCVDAIKAGDIDVTELDSLMGIPKLTKHLKPMYVKCTHKDIPEHISLKERNKSSFHIGPEHGPFYWETPLNILTKGQPITEDTAKYNTWNQYAEILDTAQKMQREIEVRQKQLHSQGKRVREIDDMQTKLLRLIASMKKHQSYPNRINLSKNLECLQSLERATVPNLNKLKAKDKEWGLIQVMGQLFDELFSRLKSFIVTPSKQEAKPGSFIDLYIINQMHKLVENKKQMVESNRVALKA